MSSSSSPSEMVAALVERMRGRDETDDKSDDGLQTFQGIARWIPRAISPFLDLHSTLNAAVPCEDITDEIPENHKRNLERIIKLHPRFPELILAFKEDPDAYDNFVAMMVEGFCNARAQDTNSARYEVPTFIPLDPLVDVVQPPITKTKSSRGFNHPVVGKLLCPLRLLQEYEADPVLFKNKVENATLQFRSHFEKNWPSFLYPPDTEYNADELDKGLFRGPILIRTLRMIYTGKGSAFTGYRSAPKRSQAEMHGMREVFPEAIAYAAVQAYYGLCSLDGWDTEDRFFKLDVFFDKCVGLFTEDPDDPWVIDTLQFLTKQMPALTRRGKRQLPWDPEEDENNSGDEIVVGILAQRARRREAAREQEARAGQIQEEQTGNQDPFEENHDSDTGRRPSTPPPSSPQWPGGDRSRSSSPSFPRRQQPTITPSRSPSPPFPCRQQLTVTPSRSLSPARHIRIPARSAAQNLGTVGRNPPRDMLNKNTASSSRGSHDPLPPPGPSTLDSTSQAMKMKTKKPASKRRRRNW